jgi:hypothetical protein
MVGIASAFYLHQIPQTETQTISLCEYQNIGTYDYTAKLGPNIMYGKSTLKPGEGTLFFRITEYLNITFTYAFQSNREANVTIKYSTREYLESAQWIKQLNATTETSFSGTGSRVEIPITDLPPISTAVVESLNDALNQEMGVYTSEYNATVVTHMQILAETSVGNINVTFDPTLTVAFHHGTTQGDAITVDGLENTQNGRLTQENTIYNDWLIGNQYFSYAITVMGSVGLILTLAPVKTKPTKTERRQMNLEEIIGPYEDVIASVAAEPILGTAVTSVMMNSMEDLVKVADSLSKPIVHALRKGDEHAFYVFDGANRYEYSVIAPTKNKTEEEYEEEED